MEMKKCPDCKGDFERGCIVDVGYGAVMVQRYARSDVKDINAVVMGVNEEKFYDLRKVITYRCTKCNRLFSYALNTVLVADVGRRTKKYVFVVLGISLLLFFIIYVMIVSSL